MYGLTYKETSDGITYFYDSTGYIVATDSIYDPFVIRHAVLTDEQCAYIAGITGHKVM